MWFLQRRAGCAVRCFNHIPQILTNNTRITVHENQSTLEHSQRSNTGFRGESLFRGNTSSVAYQTCYDEIQDDSSFSHVDPVSEVESHSCFWRDQGVSDQFEACEADYLMECYCSSNFYTLCCLEFWGDTETVLASIAKYFGVSTLISVVLVTASFIMRKFLSFIAKLEHPHSSTKMQISKAERILIFQIVNSGLTILFLPINNEAAITCDNGSCT